MDIDFDDNKIEKICLDNKEAQKKLGVESAKKLLARLHDIDAAANVLELVTGNPHPLTNKGTHRNRLGQYSISLAGANRLVFKPNQEPTPVTEGGKIDWSMVVSIIIVYIGDYHD